LHIFHVKSMYFIFHVKSMYFIFLFFLFLPNLYFGCAPRKFVKIVENFTSLLIAILCSCYFDTFFSSSGVRAL